MDGELPDWDPAPDFVPIQRPAWHVENPAPAIVEAKTSLYGDVAGIIGQYAAQPVQYLWRVTVKGTERVDGRYTAHPWCTPADRLLWSMSITKEKINRKGRGRWRSEAWLASAIMNRPACGSRKCTVTRKQCAADIEYLLRAMEDEDWVESKRMHDR